MGEVTGQLLDVTDEAMDLQVPRKIRTGELVEQLSAS
jgi:hypothetical protein